MWEVVEPFLLAHQLGQAKIQQCKGEGLQWPGLFRSRQKEVLSTKRVGQCKKSSLLFKYSLNASLHSIQMASKPFLFRNFEAVTFCFILKVEQC